MLVLPLAQDNKQCHFKTMNAFINKISITTDIHYLNDDNFWQY